MTGVSHHAWRENEPDADVWSVPGCTDIAELGKGGTGRVVIAHHTATGRYVAIKYLDGELRWESEFRTSMRAEAVLLNDLASPHVTRLYEYVEARKGAAIVMELVFGAALRALLRSGPTSPEAALVVLKGSLLGLAAAHGAGVVHRDYKPENVLVSWDGRSKLVDFGISARTGDRHGRSGTWAYKPPEHWRLEDATPAGDVYAATATFYECVTGVRPFQGWTEWDFQYRHVYEPVPVAQVPSGVRELVLHGMAKDPALRPQSALGFLAELERVAGSSFGPDWEERGQSRLAALAAALVPPAMTRLGIRPVGSATALARTELTSRRHARPRLRGELLAGAAAAVAVAGLLGVLPGGWAGADESSAGAHARAVTSLAPEPARRTPAPKVTKGDATAGDDSTASGPADRHRAASPAPHDGATTGRTAPGTDPSRDTGTRKNDRDTGTRDDDPGTTTDRTPDKAPDTNTGSATPTDPDTAPGTHGTTSAGPTSDSTADTDPTPTSGTPSGPSETPTTGSTTGTDATPTTGTTSGSPAGSGTTPGSGHPSHSHTGHSSHPDSGTTAGSGSTSGTGTGTGTGTGSASGSSSGTGTASGGSTAGGDPAGSSVTSSQGAETEPAVPGEPG
ncbi:serine/threonine-protein kinase [Streptomyces arenae]|uniref:serine/threonine-protein kinase n=1 Tax=Streptomyces arenae TaxID=29301 RepID=UPI0026582E6A|nr:serine/threonine-protein kinase [Streptomyces arenae]